MPDWPSMGATALLNKITLGSAGTFDVQNINQSYNDLILIMIVRSSDTGAGLSDSLAMRFNNDSSTNYFRSRVRGAGSSVDGAETTGTTGMTAMDMNAMPNSNASVVANSFGVFEITLFGYASTTWHKTLTYQSMERHGTTGAPQTYNTTGGGVWINTSAITRIQFMNGTSFGNLVTGSQLRIYGRL